MKSQSLSRRCITWISQYFTFLLKVTHPLVNLPFHIVFIFYFQIILEDSEINVSVIDLTYSTDIYTAIHPHQLGSVNKACYLFCQSIQSICITGMPRIVKNVESVPAEITTPLQRDWTGLANPIGVKNWTTGQNRLTNVSTRTGSKLRLISDQHQYSGS